MDRILVLTPHEDRAGRAIALARALAERQGSRLTLLRVLQEDEAGEARGSADLRLRELLFDAEEDELERLAAPLRAEGRQVSVEVCWGTPWQVTSEVAQRGGFDLIVKPAHGLDHEGPIFFGSTALGLFRHAPCPVWVVGDDGRLPCRILTAVEPSADRARRSMGRCLLAWAQRVAESAKAELHLACAWKAIGAELLKGTVPQPELDAYVRDAWQRARDGLDGLLEEAGRPLPEERLHLLEGDASEVLPRFAEEQGFDLLVVGTLGRSGVTRVLMGQTAEAIVRSVRGSVLTVGPGAIPAALA